MKIYDLLAIFGALAWLYPLFIWIRSILKKTKLEIINHKQLEIGYTTYGPVLNIDLAFSAINKNAFIRNVTVKLEHENKEIIVLQWEWFEEALLEMEMPDIGRVPYKKKQKAIAIKVPTETLIEKTIGFRSKKFNTEYSKLYSDTNQKQINISDNLQGVGQLKSSNEYNGFLDLFKNHFPWKKGKYEGLLQVEIAERKDLFTQSFSFELTTLKIWSQISIPVRN